MPRFYDHIDDEHHAKWLLTLHARLSEIQGEVEHRKSRLPQRLISNMLNLVREVRQARIIHDEQTSHVVADKKFS